MSMRMKRHPAATAVHRDSLKTAEELISTLSPEHPNWNEAPTDWIFRGHADSTWDLLPKALRKYSINIKSAVRPKVTHETQVEEEFWHLWDFYQAANSQGLPIPEDTQIYRSPESYKKEILPAFNRAKRGGQWPFDQIMSLATLAQHYGVATRLLDWSVKPLVAAYFAAKEACEWLHQARSKKCHACKSKWDSKDEQAKLSEKQLAIWCLSWRYAWNRWPGKKPSDIRVLIVTAPRASNPNLHAQGGVFTVDLKVAKKNDDIVVSAPLDRVIEETWKPTNWRPTAIKNHTSLAYPVMRCLKLPIAEAPKLLRLLNNHGVNGATVFPGFDGVHRSLTERQELWDKPSGLGTLPLI